MTLLAQQKVVVSSLNTLTRSGGWVDLLLDIEVADKTQLDSVMQMLRANHFVSTVNRVKAG